jgi:hypothetical protein
VGRTADKAWLQVVTADNQRGWVMAQFVDVFINLDTLPVTGTAVDATPARRAGDASGADRAAPGAHAHPSPAAG